MDDNKEDLIKRLAEREESELSKNASEDMKSVKDILDTADKWDTPQSRSKDEIWKSLEDKLDLTDANGVNPKIRNRITWLRVGIAAMLLIGASISYRYIRGDEIKFSTGAGEVATFFLPDSSKVILNSSSEITFLSKKYEDNRSLKLMGEGYFEVKEGNEFSVESKGILTSVLGTSFNIYSRGKTTEVKCITGKVQVKAGPKKVELNSGEMIRTIDRRATSDKFTFEAQKAISWMDGKFYYDEYDLWLVVREIELQFDIEIEGQDFEGRTYSGYFDNSSLKKALNQVLIPMGYSYTINDKVVSVK